MTGTLRAARILSSETDNTIKQEQNTNVNINIKPIDKNNSENNLCKANQQYGNHQRRPSIFTTSKSCHDPESSFCKANDLNFTQVVHQPEDLQAGQTINTQTMGQEEYPYQFQPQTDNNCQLTNRGIADLGDEIEELNLKNQFLEMLISMYENNPLHINSYVVCEHKLLMDMIKLLTGCDKVDFVLDDTDVGCGCSGNSSKILKVDKILVTVNGKTEDLKYSYNNIYTQFVKYGISLKLVC